MSRAILYQAVCGSQLGRTVRAQRILQIPYAFCVIIWEIVTRACSTHLPVEIKWRHKSSCPNSANRWSKARCSRWLIHEGERVKQDQPLLQITTDKVDTELPAPASGILLKILVPEGETVARGTVLGVIGAEDEGRRTKDEETPSSPNLGFISPVVGRLAAELGVDLAHVSGTGAAGRITKQDVLAYAAASAHESLAGPEAALPVTESLVPGHPSAETPDSRIARRSRSLRCARPSPGTWCVSKQTSPHVTTVMEADMTRVVRRASGCRASSSGRASG